MESLLLLLFYEVYEDKAYADILLLVLAVEQYPSVFIEAGYFYRRNIHDGRERYHNEVFYVNTSRVVSSTYSVRLDILQIFISCLPRLPIIG